MAAAEGEEEEPRVAWRQQVPLQNWMPNTGKPLQSPPKAGREAGRSLPPLKLAASGGKSNPNWPPRVRTFRMPGELDRPPKGPPPLTDRYSTRRAAQWAAEAALRSRSGSTPRRPRIDIDTAPLIPGALERLHRETEANAVRERQWLEGLLPCERRLREALRVPLASLDGPPGTPREEQLRRRQRHAAHVERLLERAARYLPPESPPMLAGRRRVERVRGLLAPEEEGAPAAEAAGPAVEEERAKAQARAVLDEFLAEDAGEAELDAKLSARSVLDLALAGEEDAGATGEGQLKAEARSVLDLALLGKGDASTKKEHQLKAEAELDAKLEAQSALELALPAEGDAGAEEEGRLKAEAREVLQGALLKDLPQQRDRAAALRA